MERTPLPLRGRGNRTLAWEQCRDAPCDAGASHLCRFKRPPSQNESPTKLTDTQSRSKVHFVLDFGRSAIYSTRIAPFNAGRINSKHAYRERCSSPLPGFSVAILFYSVERFRRRIPSADSIGGFHRRIPSAGRRRVRPRRSRSPKEVVNDQGWRRYALALPQKSLMIRPLFCQVTARLSFALPD